MNKYCYLCKLFCLNIAGPFHAKRPSHFGDHLKCTWKKWADLLRWKQWTARIFQREKKFCSCGWLITSWHNAVCVLFVENFVLKLPLIFSKANSVYLLSKCASVRYLKLNNNSAIFSPYLLLRIEPKCVMFAFLLQYCTLYEYLSSEYLLHRRYILRKKYLYTSQAAEIYEKISRISQNRDFCPYWDAICSMLWYNENSSLYLNCKKMKFFL